MGIRHRTAVAVAAFFLGGFMQHGAAQEGATCGPGKAGLPCPNNQVAGIDTSAGVSLAAGNPLNIVTGNKSQREVDLPALPGVLGLEIVRHYNSANSGTDSPNGLFGRGWKLSYETQLFAGARTVQIVQADGAGLIFNRDPQDPNRCAGADPLHGRIDIHQTGLGPQYTWHWPSGRKLHFDERGKLRTIVERGGETLTLHYAPGGELYRITDPQRRSMEILSGGEAAAREGRFSGIDAIEAPTGRYTYRYGSALPAGATVSPQKVLANLVRADLPTAYARSAEQRRLNQPGATTSVASRLYHYEDARFPTLLTGMSIDSAGAGGARRQQRLSTYSYDPDGRATRSIRWTQKGGVLDDIRLDFSQPGATSLRTHDGKTARYLHAIVGGQFRLLQARGDGCGSCPDANVAYRYDDHGRLVETTRLATDGSPVETVAHQLDRHGRRILAGRTHYRDGEAQPPVWMARFEYPDAAAGAVVSSQPLLVARPSVVPGREASVRFSYNSAGQVLAVTEDGWRPSPDASEPATPIQRIHRYTYAGIGEHSVLTQYDGPLPNGPANSPDDSDITRYRYNAKGIMQVATEEPMQRRAELEYDDAGRIAGVMKTFGAVKRRTGLTYMPDGRLQARTEQAFDSDAKPVGKARTTTLTHDGKSQLVSVTWPNASRTSVTHGVAGEVAGEVAGDVDTALMHDGRTFDDNQTQMWTEYGPPGSVAEHEALQLQANGKSASRLFDDFGRVVAIRNPGEHWQRAAYDAGGRLVELVDARGARSVQQYDLANRVVAVDRFAPGSKDAQESLRYKWNGPWRIEATVFASGKRAHRLIDRHDAWGQPVVQSAIVEGTGKADAAVTFSQQMRYADDGTLISRTLPGGGRIAYRYYANDAKHPAAANRLAAIDGVGWPPALDWLFTRLPERWQPLTRLVSVAPPGEISTGRPADREREPHVETGLAPDATIDQLAPSLLKERMVTPTGSFDMQWNAVGQLTRASKADGTEVARYTYDALGRRASKHTREGTEYYFHDGSQLVATAVRNSAADGVAPASQYVYQGYRPVAWIRPNEKSGFWQSLAARIGWSSSSVYSIATDRRGAVVSTSRIDGGDKKIAWTSGINAWGLAKAGGDLTRDPGLRLVNQYADKETGLHYNIARYYDPTRGRYISPDPAGVGDSIDRATPEALKLDLTAYVSGRPLEFFDPNGAAKLTYFALTTDAKGAQLGETQGFTKARWGFIVEGVRGGADSSTLAGQMRNQYAANGTGALSDVGGDFVKGFDDFEAVKTPDGNGVRWDKTGTSGEVEKAFRDHYGKNLFSASQFTIEDFDDDQATRLIWYMSTTQKEREGCLGMARGWLPQIRFHAGEADIDVTNANANGASQQRILACGAGSEGDADMRLISRYEAAAEVNETGMIGRDCSVDGCPGIAYWCDAKKCSQPRNQLKFGPPKTTDPVYTPSYGRSQFIGNTLVHQLLVAYGGMSESEFAKLGLTPAFKKSLQAAKQRGLDSNAWFNAMKKAPTYDDANNAWSSLSVAKQKKFMQETGLDERAFVDMKRVKTQGLRNSNGTSLMGDVKEAFATSAIMSDPAVAASLHDIFRNFDKFTIVARALMRQNMSAARKKFPGDSEVVTAARVARAHNGGDWRLDFAVLTKEDPNDYVKRFLGTPGFRSEGNFVSIRCTEELNASTENSVRKLEGLSMKPLTIN